MKSFDIEITETLQRTVSVIADSREEAEQMVDGTMEIMSSTLRISSMSISRR